MSLQPPSSGPLPTASTPMRMRGQIQKAKENIPALAAHNDEQAQALHPPPSFDADDTPRSQPEITAPKSKRKDKSKPVKSSTKSSAHWAASHHHLLANLTNLRSEIADWEQEAVNRIRIAEDDLARQRAQEEAEQKRVKENEESGLFFKNEYAVRQVQSILHGGVEAATQPAKPAGTERRATWNAGGSAARDLSASPVNTEEPNSQNRRATYLGGAGRPASGATSTHRTKAQDAHALQELQSVMNNDVDERWMETILDLTSPRKGARRDGNNVLSPRRQEQATATPSRPVSKVYSDLALEHRRALRRHPKISKWLEKFWRVFERQREEEEKLGIQGGMLSPITSPSGKKSGEEKVGDSQPEAVSAAAVPSHETQLSITGSSFMSGRELLETQGINKHDFVKFYQLLHKCLSGDDVDLTRTAVHDFERMTRGKKYMNGTEFGHILFEVIDLWCLTHIPEDFVSILKALYCRMTTRAFHAQFGSMRTDWVLAEAIGLGGAYTIQPLLTPFLDAERAAQKERARKKAEKQRKYELMRRERRDKGEEDTSEEEEAEENERRRKRGSAGDASSSESEFNSEIDYGSSADEDAGGGEPVKSLPLTDEDGRLLSLNAPEIVHAGNRLRARERQFVGEALMALNDTVAAFHDDSDLALREENEESAAGGSTRDGSAAFSIHSNSGVGYASRRKTIGLKWSVVSELMEGEILRAKKERDDLERRRREIKRTAEEVSKGATLAVPGAAGSNQQQQPPALSRRSTLNLDGMVLGISSRNSPNSIRTKKQTAGASASSKHQPEEEHDDPQSDRSTSRHGRGGVRIPSLDLVSNSSTVLSPSSSSGRSPRDGDGRSNPSVTPRSTGRYLYSSLDSGDSDLEDEEEARVYRLSRKKKYGHSWPSLARVLSLRARKEGLENSWYGVAMELLQRKRKADAVVARKKHLAYFKQLKKDAAQQARIAGMSLKSNLDESDIPMLEAIARISFTRGEKNRERIVELLAEREKERESELQERERQRRELERKRAVLQEKRRKAGQHAGGALSENTSPTAAFGMLAGAKATSPPLANSTLASNAATAAAGLKASPGSSPTSIVRRLESLPSGRRVSWRDTATAIVPSTSNTTSGSGLPSPPITSPVSHAAHTGPVTSQFSSLSDVKHLAHPAMEGHHVRVTKKAEEEKTKAIAEQAQREAKEKALTRAQRKAIVDAVVGRLTRAPVCINPLHDHTVFVRPGPRWGVTEIGNRYPLDDAPTYGEGPCEFEDVASPQAIGRALERAYGQPANPASAGAAAPVAAHHPEPVSASAAAHPDSGRDDLVVQGNRRRKVVTSANPAGAVPHSDRSFAAALPPSHPVSSDIPVILSPSSSSLAPKLAHRRQRSRSAISVRPSAAGVTSGGMGFSVPGQPVAAGPMHSHPSGLRRHALDDSNTAAHVPLVSHTRAGMRQYLNTSTSSHHDSPHLPSVLGVPSSVVRRSTLPLVVSGQSPQLSSFSGATSAAAGSSNSRVASAQNSSHNSRSHSPATFQLGAGGLPSGVGLHVAVPPAGVRAASGSGQSTPVMSPGALLPSLPPRASPLYNTNSYESAFAGGGDQHPLAHPSGTSGPKYSGGPPSASSSTTTLLRPPGSAANSASIVSGSVAAASQYTLAAAQRAASASASGAGAKPGQQPPLGHRGPIVPVKKDDSTFWDPFH